jgi:hypothetical protein
MMSTERQRDANRKNAEKSTGPTSEEGKAASSRNSWKHGLRALAVVYPDEDGEEYLLHLVSLRLERRPKGPLEAFLVERMAQCMWKIWRTYRLESEFIELGIGSADQSLRLAAQDPKVPKWFREAAAAAEGPQGATTALIELTNPRSAPALLLLFRYRAEAERALYKALHELERIQAARKSAETGRGQTAESSAVSD